MAHTRPHIWAGDDSQYKPRAIEIHGAVARAVRACENSTHTYLGRGIHKEMDGEDVA